ncbi:hypothetical protein F8388_004860, partial [Cannabis sativa]
MDVDIDHDTILGLPTGEDGANKLTDIKVSLGAREIFKLLPHSFVDPNKLPELFKMVNFRGKDVSQPARASNRVFQVYRCVVTCQDMVQNKDSTKSFDKADYYAHLERYNPIFHERIA